VPAGKIHTIYNGIDPSRVETTSSATRDDRLALLGIPRGAHRQFVTILANLWLALKDHPTFLRAARQVREAVPDTGFIVAGEGALREPLQRLVAELGIADCVYFTGRCQRVADLLAISDVCVLSSISEGFPNVVVEYMAAGRAVVATNVGGTKEAVSHGETGFVVPPGDVDAMAGRIEWLLRHPDARAEMGRRGRTIALGKFSCEAQLEAAETLYDRLLGDREVSRDSLPSARPARRRESDVLSEDSDRPRAVSRAS
jgi:glycosyltransferase involved in cell wall biosynthesis